MKSTTNTGPKKIKSEEIQMAINIYNKGKWKENTPIFLYGEV